MKWFLLCTFNIYLVLIASFSTLWRDEAHAALLIRESGNLQGFIAAMRFEGTPWLWHLAVYLVFQITGDAYSALLFGHLFVWILIGWLVCYGLRLGAAVAGVILFSVASYEYLLNFRQYPLSVLCAFSFAAVVIRWPRSLAAPLCLFLLAETSVNSFFISVGLFVWLIGSYWGEARLRSRNIILFFLTVIVTVLQVIPDHRLVAGLTGWQFITANEWRRFWLFLGDITLFGKAGGLVLLVALVSGVWVCARTARRELALFGLAFALALGGFVFILLFKYTTSARHHWLLTAMLVVILVIGASRVRTPFRYANYFRLLAVVALLASLNAAVTNLILLVCQVKTQGENVAAYLRVNATSPDLLLYHEQDCEAVMFYLQKGFLFYSLDRDAFVRRVKWDNEVVDYQAARGVATATDLGALPLFLSRVPHDLIAQRPLLLVAANNLKNDHLPDPFHFDAPNCSATMQRVFLFSQIEPFLVYQINPKTP